MLYIPRTGKNIPWRQVDACALEIARFIPRKTRKLLERRYGNIWKLAADDGACTLPSNVSVIIVINYV